MRRYERFDRYAHPKNTPKTTRQRLGVVDSLVTTVTKKVSDSRYGVSSSGNPLVLGSSFSYAPLLTGANSYPLVLEASGEIFDPGAVETLVFALSARSGSAHSADYLMIHDGTIPRIAQEMISTTSFQPRTDCIGYSIAGRYYVQVVRELLGGTNKVFKYEGTTRTDISSGAPSGRFWDSVAFRSDSGHPYFLTDGPSLIKYDGSSWTTIGTGSGTPVSLAAQSGRIFMATTTGVWSYNGSLFQADYIASGSIEDMAVLSFGPTLVELSGSTLSTWRRGGSIFSWVQDTTTLSSISQASLANERRMLSSSPSNSVLITVNTSIANSGATIYRRLAGGWELEGSIYSGRKFEDTSAVSDGPFYMSGSKRIAKRSSKSLRNCITLILPYRLSTSGSLPGDGIDIWSRRKIDNSYQWMYDVSIENKVIEDETNMIIPTIIGGI